MGWADRTRLGSQWRKTTACASEGELVMNFRRTAAGLVAGVAALSLVGAAAPTAPVGTASTSLLGAEIEVTNLGDVPVVRILDVGTFASTDTDAARNTLGNGVPFAQAAVVPLKVGDTVLGATTASSNTGGSASSDGVSYGDALSALGVDVTPVSTSANASATQALASVNTLVADVTALIGALGVEINVTGLTSQVTANGSSAIQGINVGEVSLTLADLGLTEDLLGQLPLGDLLALLENLPVPLPADVLAAVDAVNAALADVQAAAAAFGGDLGPIADGASALQAVVAELEMLTGLQADLALLNPADPVGIAAFLAGLVGTDELDFLTSCGDLLTEFATVVTCVDDAVAAATTVRDDLVTSLTALVDALPVDVAALETLITALTDALATLDGLIAELLSLLPDVAGTELLSVGAFDVGITALATDAVGSSAATVGCTGIDVTVLGETFTTPDCSEGLSAISDALAGLSDAVTGVVDLLNTLPLSGLVEVGDLTLDVFGGLTESVVQDGSYVVSTAGVNLLELAIPSITVDPDAITDLVGLELPDVVGIVTATLEDVLTELETVTGTVVDTAITTVNDTLTALGDPGGLTELVATLDGVIAGLDLGSLGSLDAALSTPGLRVLIDPTSTAQYAAGAPATPTTPTTPAPTPTPTLPTTGGGLALAGLLALAGAAAFRRRN
jgi:MYXO-CTERM domain-containing protein